MTDYYIGDNNLDINNSLDGDMIEFDYENEVIFKRLANDIYKSGEAGIREPLQNAITAVKKAKRQDYIDDGVVSIKIHDNGDMRSVKIQDNGIGITDGVLEDVLSVIGRSVNRYDGELSGKFGMGFLAFYKLVGTDGGFMMHTRSRETNDNIKGIWKPGGFVRDTNDELGPILDDDVYGTVFNFSTDVGGDSLVRWVEKHSEWSSIPIRLTVYNQDDEQVIDEEYGCKDLSEVHDKSIKINKDHYELVAEPENSYSRSKVVLINSPVDINTNFKYNTTVRLKREDGIIIDGPNKDKIPVSESKYDNIDDTSEYIRESDILSDDVRLPEPIGTRESLKNMESFVEHINQKVDNKFKKELKSIKNKIEENIDNVSQDEFGKFHKISTEVYYRDSEMYKDLNMSDKYKPLFERFNYTTNINNPKQTENPCYQNDYLYNIRYEVEDIENVFVYKTYKKKKGYILDDQIDDYVLLHLDADKKPDGDSESGIEYDDLEKLGIRKFKRIKKITGCNKDIEDDLDPDSITTNIRKKSRINDTVRTTKYKISNLPDRYGGDKKLILFKQSKGKNVTDYDHIISPNINTTNVDNESYEYLEDYDGIYGIEEFIEKQRTKIFKTSDGELTIDEILGYNGSVLIHETDNKENAKESKQILDEFINQGKNYDILLSTDKIDGNILYVPVDDKDDIKLSFDVINSENTSMNTVDEFGKSSYTLHRLDLEKDIHNEVVDIVPRDCTSEADIQMLANNISFDNSDKPTNQHKYKTDKGIVTVDDILSCDNILIHAVPHQMIDVVYDNITDFKQIVTKDVNIEPDIYVIVDEGDLKIFKKEIAELSFDMYNPTIVTSQRFNSRVSRHRYKYDIVDMYRDVKHGSVFGGFNFTSIEQIDRLQ